MRENLDPFNLFNSTYFEPSHPMIKHIKPTTYRYEYKNKLIFIQIVDEDKYHLDVDNCYANPKSGLINYTFDSDSDDPINIQINVDNTIYDATSAKSNWFNGLFMIEVSKYDKVIDNVKIS